MISWLLGFLLDQSIHQLASLIQVSLVTSQEPRMISSCRLLAQTNHSIALYQVKIALLYFYTLQ